MNKIVTNFKETSDPNSITIKDVTKWCTDLGQFIAENPTSSDRWVAKSKILTQKLEAVDYLMRNP